MELPKNAIVLEEEIIAAEVELDEEDHDNLIYDCHNLLMRVLARNNPHWLQNEGLALTKKLEAALSWHKIH